MDGILVNTEPLHYHSYQQALEPYGIPLSEEEYYELWVKHGKGIADFAVLHNLSLDYESFRAKRRQLYHALLQKSLPVMPGAPEKVKELAQQYSLSLVSSSHSTNITTILKCTSLKQYFKVIIGADHVAKTKPAPDGFLLAVQKLNLTPDTCVVIEDAEKGIHAAYAAGIKSIAIPTEITKHNDFSKATIILRSIEDITPRLLESL